MKVSDLLEAYEAPAKNKKLGYIEKSKIPTGGTKEWLKTFGATDVDIKNALRVVRQGPQYKAILALGMKDESTDRHSNLGSIMFIGELKFRADVEMSAMAKTKLYKRRMKLTVQPNGKIDETAQNDHHRAPMASGKPHIVPGDAELSIVKTMNAALEKMASNLTNRRAREAKDLKKHAEHQAFLDR